ncbi:InlB B-repeat-containing protein, partial [Bifidobacterium panos]
MVRFSSQTGVGRGLPRWLAAVLSALVVLAVAVPGAGLAGVRTAQAATNNLINGDFEYPGLKDGTAGYWNYISPLDGTWYNADGSGWTSIPDWEDLKFGWLSTQVATTKNPAAIVEIQKDSTTGNIYGELCADQADKAIYQDVATTVGTRYTVELDHASRASSFTDGLQVVVGGQTITMTRISTNKAGDKVGESGTVVSTHATNTGSFDSHDGQWARYRGSYVATSETTRFTFKSVSSATATAGNLLDNIRFVREYPFTYDVNLPDGATLQGDAPVYKNGSGEAYVSEGDAAVDSSGWTVGDTSKVEGYHFDGWCLNKSGVSAYDWNTQVSGLTTVYAKWTPNSYKINYNLDGGTLGSDSPTSHTYLTKTTLVNPTKSGYEFSHWTDQDGNTVTEISADTKKEMTLTAHWTAKSDTEYKVEHYLQNVNDDGYTLQSKDTQTLQGESGAQTKAVAKTTYTGFTAVTPTQEAIAGDGSTVVKVYYTRDKHNVTFDENGHGTKPAGQSDVKFGATVDDPGSLSADGYTFGGWYEDQECTDAKKWVFSKNTMPADDLTLHAKWIAKTDTGYKVEHYLQDVDDNTKYTLKDTDEKSGETGQDTAAVVKTYTGFTAPAVVQEKIKGDGSTVVKLYYTRDTNKVTFAVGTDGALVEGVKDSVEVKTDQLLSKADGFQQPDVNANAGRKFVGWQLGKDGPVYQPSQIGGLTVSSNTTFNAVYEQLPEVSVVYSFNGGHDADGNTSVTLKGVDGTEYTDEAKAKVPDTSKLERTGYAFKEWSPAVTGKYASVTYTAQWTANTNDVNFVVSENDKHGSLTGNTGYRVLTGEKVGGKPTVTADGGYRFVGWVSSENDKVYSQDSVDAYVVSGANKDITFTAKFVPESSVEVHYNYAGGY